MNRERKRKIESYGKAYQKLILAIKRFPKEMWQFRPGEDRWTIHEIIVHLTDSEVNSYVRCRRFIAEPGGTILGYNEAKWATELGYHNQNTEDALELFKWLRNNTYNLIKDLPESVWSNEAHHTEDGLITMDTWLDIYERHIPDHIQQMQIIYNDWLKMK
jgi:hypothetical protein